MNILEIAEKAEYENLEALRSSKLLDLIWRTTTSDSPEARKFLISYVETRGRIIYDDIYFVSRLLLKDDKLTDPRAASQLNCACGHEYVLQQYINFQEQLDRK